MYTLISECQNPKFIGKIEVSNLKELYHETSSHDKNVDFKLSSLYDNLDYSILVLKFIKDDFLIIYANDKWNVICKDFTNYMKGKFLTKLFPDFDRLNTYNLFKKSYNTNTRVDSILRLYKDDILLFVGEQFCLRQDDLLYVFVKNETEKYLTLSKETSFYNKCEDDVVSKPSKKIFYNLMSYFNELEKSNKTAFILNDGEMFQWSDNIFNILGIKPDYDLLLNSSNILFNYIVPEDKKIVRDYVNSLSLKNSHVQFDFRIETLKKSIIHLRASLRILETGVGYFGFIHNITEEFLDKQKASKLQKNLDTITNAGNIGMVIYKNKKYHYNSEIFKILGFFPESENLTFDYDIIAPYVINEDKDSWVNILNSLSPENSCFHKLTTLSLPNTDLKIIDNLVEAEFSINGELVEYVAYVRDVTEEELVKNEAFELKENLESISDFSKIVVVTFKDGKFSWTPEIYKILKISPNDYEDNEDLIREFIHEEDQVVIGKIFRKLSPENNYFSGVLRVFDTEGELKYLKYQLVANFDEEDNMLSCTSLLQDVTDEEIAKKSSLDLQDSLNTLGEFSKIVIGSYENGKYKWTPEIYNILKINSSDYEDDVDLLSKFTSKEDNLKFLDAMCNLSSENNTYSDMVKIYDSEGELKYLNVKVVAELDRNGVIKTIHKFIQDVTEEAIARESVLELDRILNIVQDASKIVLVNYNNGKFTWTPEIYDILEIDSTDYLDDIDLIDFFSIPELKNSFNDKLNRLTPDNHSMHHIITVKTVNGNVKYLESFVEAEFDENAVLTDFVAFVQEITDKVVRERELEELSEERKLLLQEVHHRVKNNLQLVSSYLSLDSRYYKDNPGYVISKTKNRIDAMAVTHEEVYQSEDMSSINLSSLFVNVLNDLFSSAHVKNIKRKFNCDPIFVDIDDAMSLSFLINELAFNTIRHAFPNNDLGSFNVNLKSTVDNIVLEVWDDGVGLPEGVNFLVNNSLGFIIIRRLTAQLEANINVLKDVPGFGVRLTIPQ
jgi:two-component sensor histidine kinase/PAS domain-containing protein